MAGGVCCHRGGVSEGSLRGAGVDEVVVKVRNAGGLEDWVRRARAQVAQM